MGKPTHANKALDQDRDVLGDLRSTLADCSKGLQPIGVPHKPRIHLATQKSIGGGIVQEHNTATTNTTNTTHNAPSGWGGTIAVRCW